MKLKINRQRHQKGNIVMPILFVVTIFAILLTSGKLLNVSIPKLKDGSSTKISEITQLQATSDESCRYRTSQKVDLALCKKCKGWLVNCVNNKCAGIDSGRSNTTKDISQSCKIVDSNNLCESFSKEGDGWYCL